MSLRIRRGGLVEGTLPPEPPGGGSGYAFPTTSFQFPVLSDDGGTAANDGMINVLHYGAVGDGVTDDTGAIQNAIFDNRETNNHPWSKKTLFFPGTPASPKTYKVSSLNPGSGPGNHLRGILERRDNGDSATQDFHGGLRIQGETETGAIIRLADDAPEFQNPADPRFVIYQSNYNALPGGGPHTTTDGTGLEGYFSMIRDITIDLGSGNPGAVGINVMMHNVGWIRRVTVQDAVGAGRTANNALRAFCGFAEERQGAGPNHLARLTVKGCQYGFRIAQIMCGQGIEHLRLENQGTCGIVNDSNGLFIRGLVSNNAVPVAEIRTGTSINHFDADDTASQWVHALLSGMAYHDDTQGYLLIVDAELTGVGAASGVSAIRNRTAGGKMFLRNVSTHGYARAAEEDGGVAVQAGAAMIGEYASPPVQNLWGQAPRSLNIVIKNTPEKSYSTLAGWTSVTAAVPGFPNGVQMSHAAGTQVTNTWAALQAAIDNCSTDTLYFPSTRDGRVRFSGSGTIHVRGNVRHIVGMGAMFYATSTGQTLTWVFDHPTRPVDQEAVIVEDIRLSSSGSGIDNVVVIVDTPRDVVMLDTNVSSITNTANATGTIFLEDVLGGVIDLSFPQDVFARQDDVDAGNLMRTYSGGDCWFFYVKSEQKGDSDARMLPTNQWSGRIEILGGWAAQVTGVTSTTPLFTTENTTGTLAAQFSAAGYATSTGGVTGNFSVYAREIQNGIQRDLVPGGNSFATALAPRGSQRHLTLYRSKF